MNRMPGLSLTEARGHGNHLSRKPKFGVGIGIGIGIENGFLKAKTPKASIPIPIATQTPKEYRLL